MKKSILLYLVFFIIPALSFAQIKKVYQKVGENYREVGAAEEVGFGDWRIYQKRGGSYYEIGKIYAASVYVKEGNSFRKVMEDSGGHFFRTDEYTPREIGKYRVGIMYALVSNGNWLTGPEYEEVGKYEGAFVGASAAALLLLFKY